MISFLLTAPNIGQIAIFIALVVLLIAATAGGIAAMKGGDDE